MLLLMPRTRIAVGAAAAVSIVLAGCTAGTAHLAAGDLQAAAADPDSGSWTVLVYSIADTNLDEPLMDDLEELASVGSRRAQHRRDGRSFDGLHDPAAAGPP